MQGASRLLPPFYFFLAIGLMVLLHYVLPVAKWLSRPWNFAGMIPIVAGLSMVVVANQLFKRVGTTIKPFQPSSALVTTGMFRFSRNPIYVSLVVALIGIAWVLGTVSPLIVIPLFALWIGKAFVAREELHLEEQFGDPYREYKESVRRWI